MSRNNVVSFVDDGLSHYSAVLNMLGLLIVKKEYIYIYMKLF